MAHQADCSLGAAAYRMRATLDSESDPVCRVLDGSSTVGELPVLEELSRTGCFQVSIGEIGPWPVVALAGSALGPRNSRPLGLSPAEIGPASH